MRASTGHNPPWTLLAPAFGVLSLSLAMIAPALPGATVLLVIGLFGCVVAAVHHAEVIAHRVGEPFGTIVLALAVTAIEVALIVTMMLAGGANTTGLARDTVFAAVMLILNGIIGLSLIAGSRRHSIQHYHVEGITAALATLTAIVVLTLVLPNFTTTTRGPTYTDSQLVFISVVTLVLFASFTLFQTGWHRNYFLAEGDGNGDPTTEEPPSPGNREALASLGLLLVSLAVVVLSAKALAPTLEGLLAAAGAPPAVTGIAIAAIVLLPEGVAAVRAARNDRVQTSLNLAMGSAIASIGLTIPTVSLLAVAMQWPLALGLDDMSIVLLFLSLFVASISLRTGRTNLLIGIVHAVLLGTYLFLSFVP